MMTDGRTDRRTHRHGVLQSRENTREFLENFRSKSAPGEMNFLTALTSENGYIFNA